jgi:hypothetical protein
MELDMRTLTQQRRTFHSWVHEDQDDLLLSVSLWIDVYAVFVSVVKYVHQ